MATLDISSLVAKTKGNLDLVVRKVTLDVMRSLVMKSPVDTGRFRGNWQFGVNTMPTGYSDDKSKSGSAPIRAAVDAMPATTYGNKYYLINNLPYAQALENGHSKGQAPLGMVGITVIEFQSHFSSAVAGAFK